MRCRNLPALVMVASVVAASSSCDLLIGLDKFHDGICTPGTAEVCPYPGPSDSEGVGICKAGTRTCDQDGLAWSACSDPTLPKEEDCSTPEDENCDGEVNEETAGCCKPGSTRSCYKGPEGT